MQSAKEEKYSSSNFYASGSGKIVFDQPSAFFDQDFFSADQ
jgi:hypothetical protein